MKRIPELDYLKGILILLVISFHLVYFEQLHPFAKQVVYTFHMPGFLLLSGYLMNVGKEPRDFLRMISGFGVPYLFMASGYIYMASLLPINDHIDNLTPLVFLDRLLLHPLGPTWYLHSLVICGGIYYLVFRYLRRGLLVRLLAVGLVYYLLAHVVGMLSFSSALYFLAGAAIRQSGTEFLSFFRPGKFALPAFVLLVCFSVHPTQASIEGALIAYFAISSLLMLYRTLPLQGKVWRGACFLGRNSLPLYVFSPIFTMLCKRFVPFLQFDPTGFIFLFVSLVCCVGGSLAIGWLMDLVGISRFFFYGRRALSI